MYVLGVNAVFHESAACLLRDGALVAMAEEERFTRVKHAKKPREDNPHELPTHAIRSCLDAAGIELADVDHVGYSSDPAAGTPEHVMWTAVSAANIAKVPGRLEALGFRGTFHRVDHHAAHAASAYYASDFADAAVLSIDGIGDGNSTSWFRGRGHALEFVGDVKSPHSIGFLWELCSMFLGFDIYDATKLMGLSAYGDPGRYREAFRRLIRPTPGGFVTDEKALRFHHFDYLTPTGYFAGLERLFGVPRRERGAEYTAEHKDIAAALQEVTDEVILHVVRHMHEATGSENLCVAGGVALNCVTNSRVFEAGPFRRLYVQPSANDAGTAPGAAWYIHHHLLGRRERHPMTHPYWGPWFTADEMERTLQAHQLLYTHSDAVEAEVARLLDEGNVVAFFQGRMEVGPRALGNRSLLADPRDPNVRDLLNHKVKHREYFRPFAPSVLAEEAGEWFEIAKPTPAAEFMLMAYPVKPHLRERVPAVIHEDGTSRIQAVRREANPRYHKVISEFHRRTGVPMVLNTSFNDSEPIVCTPADAVATFLKTDIDYLVIGDFVVSKAANAEAVRWWRQKNAPTLTTAVERVLERFVVTKVGTFHVASDALASERLDAVVPPFPEHAFFLDELLKGRLRGASVLAVGSGTGLLPVAALKAGAASVVALEGNPRSAMLTGFNAVLNGLPGHVEFVPADDLSRVEGRFDYVMANPLFAPGAAGSRAAIHGLAALERLLPRLDDLLTDRGHAQVATFVAGDGGGPTTLIALLERHLSGAALLRVNPESVSYEEYLHGQRDAGFLSAAAAAVLRRDAEATGLTRLHLCMLHVEKGGRALTVEPARAAYGGWLAPLPGVTD